MGRLLAIDFGKKRCGIAVTDILQIIATPLTTVDTPVIYTFLEKYLLENQVDCIIVGQPTRMSGEFSEIESDILAFIEKIKLLKNCPKIERINEAYTSKLAMQSMHTMQLKKKQRQDKRQLDKTSATIILQDYMQFKGI